jgi:transcriptional regulator with XRE-family HTH domain
MLDEERASVLLRRARRVAGLTQSQLAELAGTSQSAIAAYESGAREPTLPVLNRMIRASGHLLSVTVAPDPRLFRLTDLANQIRATDNEQRRMRLVFEFLRGADEDGQPVRLLVAAEPAPTGDRRFDALLAAIAEDLCVHAEIAPPSWVHDSDRYLDGFWWVSNLPSARARALVHTPASYRRRGVMLDRHDLTAA